MNSIIYKTRTRFSVVKIASNTSVASLIYIYQATEKSFFLNCVKTKQAFVSFTPTVTNHVNTETETDAQPTKKINKASIHLFTLDLITNTQLFSSIFFDQQKSVNKFEITFFSYMNRFIKIKALSQFDYVIHVNKPNYINTCFFYIRNRFNLNRSPIKNGFFPFFYKNIYFVDFSKTNTYATAGLKSKTHLFNAFSRNSKFSYLYYTYTLKKNTRETVGFFNDTSLLGNSNNQYIREQASNIEQPLFSKKKITNTVAHINEYAQYTPVKKRKIVVKRQRWKRKVSFSGFFKKHKKQERQKGNYRVVYKKKLTSKNQSSFKKSRLIGRKSIFKNRKKKFYLSRILYNYLFTEDFVSSRSINIITNKRRFVNNKRNTYFYSFSNLTSIPNPWKLVGTIKKPKIKLKRFTVNKGALYAKNPTLAKFNVKSSKKSKKAFSHNNRRVQFTGSTNKLQKNVPSIQYRFLENFIQRTFGTKISLFRINAFSFTRYSFNNALKEKEFEVNKKKKRPDKFNWEDYKVLINKKKSKKVRGVNLTKRKEIAYKRTSKNIKYIDTNLVYNQIYATQKYAQANIISDVDGAITKGLPQIFILSKQNTKKKTNFNKKFISKKAVKNSNLFIKALEKERTLRYRYTAVYIKDLLRLTFVGFYYKHAQLIREFAAFILKKLPRNRKETKFLRFIIKIRKVFAAQREEVVGMRLRFQGRVNRWRRTKHIVGRKGIFPLHTFDTYIAYGRAQAITRKGAFGRRLWMAYRSFFGKTYRTNFFT